VRVSAPDEALHRIRLHFAVRLPEGVTLLGDAFERGYGDLEWRGIVPERRFFWYFVSWHLPSGSGFGLGVETGAAALAHFTVDQAGYTLTLDTQNGGSGVQLGDRELLAATVRGMESPAGANATSRQLTQALCRRLCSNPRLPSFPVYGGNNWYYAYGRSSHEQILRDAELMASLAPADTENRPFMVIDDGWQPSSGFGGAMGGPHTHGNARFPDMPGLAQQMRERGTRPGIWIRPLGAAPGTAENLLLNRERAAAGEGGVLPTLDPTLPENTALIADDIRRLTAEWGYELVKHDFTTFDLFGRWGFAMAGVHAPRLALRRPLAHDGGDHFRPVPHDPRRRRETRSCIGLQHGRASRRGAVRTATHRRRHVGARLGAHAQDGREHTGVPDGATRHVLRGGRRLRRDHAGRAGARGRSTGSGWTCSPAPARPLFVSADPDAITGDIRAALTEAFAHRVRAPSRRRTDGLAQYDQPRAG
jgi:hypothetical protein